MVVERWRYPEWYVCTAFLPHLLDDVRRLKEPDLAARIIRSRDVFRSLDIGHGVQSESESNRCKRAL